MDLCASEVPKIVSTGKSGPHHVDLTIPNPAADEVLAARLSNRTDALYPRHLCLHELLQDSFARNPDATAVEFEGRTLTYSELDARSNQLARLLLQKGAGPEILIGLCMERSLEMVVALLGILKAGAAYVPLDPSYPRDRIKYVLDDARVRLLITQAPLVRSLEPTGADIVCLDPDWSQFLAMDPSPVSASAKPENLAYVIYTSGSTGQPKGVQLEHRSVVNFLCSMSRYPGMTEKDILIAVTTLSFDIAGLEMYLPLMAGGKLVVASKPTTMDGRLLTKLLQQSGATIMQGTPTTWRVLLESGWEGNSRLKVLVGGEALSADLARQLMQRCGSVWNMYGPTETTIWSSIYKVEGEEFKLVPIGKPIANTSFYILDANRMQVPDGLDGELYIAGDGLARGYLERDELTSEKFVSDPYSPTPGARMYRTGDLARYRQDGNVEFLGRIDQQVKIRGFRIELGEIEAVLEQHNGVNQAVVIAREDQADEKRLVAYFVPDALGTVRSAALREHVEKQLPDYMIPTAFVELDTFPLTPNGKLDRKSLPAPTIGDFEASCEFVAPRNETEHKLVQLWEEVLGISPISVTANFFEVGGRSVLAARLFTKILRVFGKELPLSTLFRSPTLEQLAQELHTERADGAYPTLVAIRETGLNRPFFCIHGGAGSTLFLRQLADELGPAHPLYGIEPEGLDGRPFQRPTVEEMAAHYLAEIRKVQPHGPYYFGGYCFGGLVAFQMACMLHAQGENPALVALFSAALRFNQFVGRQTGEPSRKPFTARLARAISSPIRTVRSRARSAYWQLIPLIRSAFYRLLFSLGLRVPPGMRTVYVAQTLGQAERSYRPKPYSGSIVFFYGPGTLDFGPNLGWDGLAERFEHCVIGDDAIHNRRDIMNKPLVGITAKELAPFINGEREWQRRTVPLAAD